jgi:hypothetical protein
MQISGVSLTLTWPLRLCLFRVLLGAPTTVTSFPLSKPTGGGDTAPAFSGLHVYLQLTWEVGLPPSPVEFSSHHHFYKHSCFCLLGVCCCSCLLQPGLFIYSSVRDSLPPIFGAQGTPPSLLCALLFLLLITQFLFFPWVGVGLSRGLC